MLPDFPAAKDTFYERIIAPRMRAIERSGSGPFAESPRSVIHEFGKGAVSEWVREDGSVEYSKMVHAEVKVEQDLRELERMSPEDVLSKLDEIASKMGSMQMKANMKKIEETIRGANRGIDLGGKPLTADAVLDMWENILIPFDEKGEPQMPSVIVHPDVAKKLMERLKDAEGDERLKARYDRIIEKKRDEWHAREASRELVG